MEKKDKALYLPKKEPLIVDIPPMNYLTITGEGNPNDEAFSICVQSLYATAYGIKMLPKQGITPEGYYDYTVFPLEGVWSLSKKGIQMQMEGADLVTLKDYFIYKVMIRQPAFVDSNLVDQVKVAVAKKKKALPINQVKFEMIEEGKAVQMMHIGSYDSETESFGRMEDYAKAKGLRRINKTHKEIYLTKPNDDAPEKQKTTLRFWVV